MIETLTPSCFQEMLHSLAAGGVYITTFTWEPDGVWSTSRAPTRGGAFGRAADAAALAAATAEPRDGRAYSREELWENMEHLPGLLKQGGHDPLAWRHLPTFH